MPKMMAQYPRMESIGSRGSIVFGILEVQLDALLPTASRGDLGMAWEPRKKEHLFRSTIYYIPYTVYVNKSIWYRTLWYIVYGILHAIDYPFNEAS